MNTNSYKLILLACIAGSTLIGCTFSPEQKTQQTATPEKAKANIKEASEDLGISRLDSSEYAIYKVESEMRLRENELLIADMKDKMKSERIESMVKYKNQLDSLDMQNSKLRNDISMYNPGDKAGWESFKKDFNGELDALGKVISQLAERNIKKAV